MRQPGLILLEILISLSFYASQLYTPRTASKRYISSISALGVSWSFTPIHIHMLQEITATDHPNHWMSGSPPLNVKALTIARINPNHLQPSIL